MAAEEGISLFSRAPAKPRKSRPTEEDVAELATGQEAAPGPATTELEPRAAREGQEGPCTFRSLGLSEWMAGVCTGLGMREPTPVQRACIPPILAGRDVIAVSQTGTGKTASYALPLLQLLARDPYGIFALVLTPTRELAMQIGDHIRALGAGGALRDAVVIGGVDTQAQARALAARPHIVVATPGRLAGLLELDPHLGRCFARLRCLVLDEADRMLEPGFESELAPVLAVCPTKRQTLLLSATMTKSLVELQQGLLPDAFHYEAYQGLQTAARLREEFLLVPARVKEVYLAYVLRSLTEWGLRSAVVFVSTRRNCSLLHHLLAALEVKTAALHSGRSQRERTTALDTFRAGVVPILLATDVAARGLDIPEVDLVVNYDLPQLARDYVHRVGRTARAGRKGWALSFVTQYEVEMFKGIETLLGRELLAWDPAEADVLKDITKVYAAKRLAALRCAEEEDSANGNGCKSRKRKAAAAGDIGGGVAGQQGAAKAGSTAAKQVKGPKSAKTNGAKTVAGTAAAARPKKQDR